MITPETLDSAEYIPAPGTQYELHEGCVRTLARATYQQTVDADALIYSENTYASPGQAGYIPDVRIAVMDLVTNGDDYDKQRVDMGMVSRIVADFFSLRIMKPAKPLQS